MGYSISWIALRDKAPDEAVKLLGLAPTGDTEEVPESMFSGMQLGTGWYLVVINQHGHPLVQEKSLHAVSATCDVVAATIEEHVMSSSVECWKDGRLQWSVAHESESGAGWALFSSLFDCCDRNLAYQVADRGPAVTLRWEEKTAPEILDDGICEFRI